MTMISDNLQSVHARIHAACARAGRPPQDVSLLAVSKTFGPEAVEEAFAAGQRAFGENYIQEAIEKMAALRHLPIEWHCIGPIQSNKTRLVAEHFDWAHTVDRLKTAQRLSDQRPAHLAPLQVCVQVNIDGGVNKSGAAPDEAGPLAHAITLLPRLQLRGLMCIPEPAADYAAACVEFSKVWALYYQVLALNLSLSAPFEPPLFDTLSMGMSADMEAAIQCGSTMVRVGSAIFGDRSPHTTLNARL